MRDFLFLYFFFLIKLICAGWGPSEFIPPPTLRINSRFFKRKVRKELAAIFQKKESRGMTTHVHTDHTRKEDSQNSSFKRQGKPETHRKSHFSNVTFPGIRNFVKYAIFEVSLF